MENLQSQAQGAVGVGLSEHAHPTGSAFSDPKVQNAAKALQNLQGQGDVGVGLSNNARPTASYFDDPDVARGINSLAQTDQGAVGQSKFKRPSGSTFDDPRVEQSVKNLGEMQAQIGGQAGLGVSEFKHATSSNINEKTAPQIEAVSNITPQNNAIYMAHNALNGGEISPDMLARFDQPRYQTGCESLVNMVVLPQGGITKRPGLVCMGLAGNEGGTSTTGRLLPFVFSADESRIMELYAEDKDSTAKLRIWYPDGTSYETEIDTNYPDWPYKGKDLSGIQIAQSADVVYIAHTSYKPGKIMRYNDGSDESARDWRYEVINWLPEIKAPKITGHKMIGGTSSDSQIPFSYIVTAISEETGEESEKSASYDFKDKKMQEAGRHVVLYFTGVSGAIEYHVYRKESGTYGFIGIVKAEEVKDDGTFEFEDVNYTPDTADTPPEYKNPFDGKGNYPGVVFLHQQRLGFAATKNQPLTIWFSQVGNYESLAASIPPEDDDAIEVTLAANQANRIVWCQSDRNILAVGTSGGEWTLQATDSAAITPSDLSFQPQTSHGSQINSMPVIRAGGNLIYMQRGGRVIREFGYSFNSDRYESGDLGILAKHILQDSAIVHWAWQAEPYGIVWCVQSNGKMAGITYMREHDVIAWHRHETKGKVKDVATITGADGNTQVWCLVDREGKRYVERMAPFFKGKKAADAVHVDGVDKDTFKARCIPCLPETQISHGSSFLHVRKINAVKARVIYSMPFSVRVGDSEEIQIPARGADFTAGHKDWAVPLASGWREDDRLELIFDGKDPATVLGIVTTVEVADMTGGQL